MKLSRCRRLRTLSLLKSLLEMRISNVLQKIFQKNTAADLQSHLTFIAQDFIVKPRR